MRLPIIAILITLSAICTAQQDSIKLDTIALTPAHAEILPQLMTTQMQLEKEISLIREKIFILLTAYIDPKKINDGKVAVSADHKKIIVK